MIVYAVDIGSLLTTALSIISIATLAGLGLLRGTVTNLRESLKDAREDIADKDRRHFDDENTIHRQKSDLEALARVVTGEAHWVALGDKMDKIEADLLAILKRTGNSP